MSYILNKYLSRYIDNLDTDSLNISIWSGQVELTDLTLKPEALVSARGCKVRADRPHAQVKSPGECPGGLRFQLTNLALKPEALVNAMGSGVMYEAIRSVCPSYSVCSVLLQWEMFRTSGRSVSCCTGKVCEWAQLH